MADTIVKKAPLSYVFSAPNYLRIYPSVWSKENPEMDAKLTEIVKEGLNRVRNRCREIMTDDPVQTGILYNAYTEPKHGFYFNDHQNFDFDELYADSGGLQVVTAGKKLTDDIKTKIYESQKQADFGFCFDEIPLGVKNPHEERGSHRSMTTSKIFYHEDFDRCAKKTARNIKEQTEALADVKTKVFYIAQGNRSEDMFRWFSIGTKVLGKENFDKIRGIALADTCIGNGELESVDMIVAYRLMLEKFGPDYTKKHLHLLGIGAPPRLLPTLFLRRSGFIPNDVEISFDSSSSSMSYVMGNFIDSDGTRTNREYRKSMVAFEHLYHDMGDLIERYSPGIDHDWYMDWTRKHYKSVSETTTGLNDDNVIGIRASISLMCIWQNIGFFSRVKQAMTSDEVRQTGVGYLSEVKTLQDYVHWKRQFERHLVSKRIDRNRTNDLADMWS